jgi:diguanylate cyclase (GGDEF)-like protein
MTDIQAGILLPQETLTEHWFIVLSTFVAFNTIIYLGLTISKLIPWPRQIHPSRVRGILATFTFLRPPEAAVPAHDTVERPESDDPYEQMRLSIARRDIPQAFALVGGLVVIFSLATFLTLPGRNLADAFDELVAGLVLLVAAQVLGRRPFRARTMMWTWAIAMAVLAGLLSLEAYRNDSQLPLAYTLIILTAYAPVTLSWRPTLITGGGMLAFMVIVSLTVTGNEDARLIAATVAALMVSFVLLQLRLSAIDDLAGERARTHALETTDLLTGLLSRQGLVALLPGLAATAERSGQEVCVMLFDIDDLAKANTEYGTKYGDDVITAVADSIRSTVRRGDLLARWGGDEFVVAGLGGRPDAEAMSARIAEAVRRSGVNLGKWQTSVSVRTAAGDPGETTFDALLAQTSSLPSP